MPRVKGGATELNRLLRSAMEEALESGLGQLDAEKAAWEIAEALGWRREDNTWKTAEEQAESIEKRVDVTPNFVRVRVRRPGDFTPGSFRFITLSKSRGIRAVIGRLKGKTTTARQSIVFDRKKGWTAATAEKWVRDHGMTPV
jgi:hypothetical protein